MDLSTIIINSDLDKREYRIIKLENGLRAILVSDVENLVSLTDNEIVEPENAEKESADSNDENEGSSENEDDEESEPIGEKMAACSLCISVGSFSDPPDIQGLAHFLEHMVFMGSAKYPQENAIDDFLKNRGGSNNGSTEFEYTSFYIECREAHLAEGMDLFGQFFISPLLIKEAMTREREAVDSEFEMALPSDGTRLEQLLGSFSPEGHPAKSFPWGNKLTLQELVDDDKLHRSVRDFWLRHYSADRMTLAVVARLPLDDLEKYVRNSFSDVPNRNLPPIDLNPFRGMPWGPEFNCLLWIKPIYDLCEVSMTWILPPYDKEYESRPLAYFSSLLGHEGEGSLLSFMKKKVLGLKVSAGNDGSGFEFNSVYSVFTITVELTQDGLKRIDEVFSAVFSYIAMLKENLPNKRYFDEIHDLADARFKYKNEEDVAKYAEELAQNMQFYRPEHYIAGDELYFKYNPELILSLLNNLTPGNVNISIHCKDHPDSYFDKEEQWFKTKYRMEPIPDEWKNSWLSAKPLPEFFLPKVNRFVTKKFSLLNYDEGTVPAYPLKVLDTHLIELWYRQDIKFKRPFAVYNLYLLSPCSRENPLNATLLRTLAQFVQLKLEETLYPAREAGYGWSCCIGDHGLLIFFYGYDEKLPLLYEEVLIGFKNVIDTMVDASNESLFAAVKCDISRSYYNDIIEASNLNNKVRLSLLLKHYNSDIDCLAEINNMTLEKLQKFCLELLNSCRCFMLIQGNISQDSAIEIAQKLPKILHISSYLEKPKTIIWNIETGKEVFYRVPSLNPDDNNASITNYYQLGPRGSSVREICILDLIQILMREPLFNSLRTQQQVGYDVSAENRNTFGVLGYSVTVEFQGNKFTAEIINDKIEKFLHEFSEKLLNLTPLEINEAKENLIVLKRIVDISLAEEIARNFAEITSGEFMFDRLLREAEEIPKITHEEIYEMYQNLILKKKKKLSTQITPGFPQKKENGKYVLKPICPDPSCYISDVASFLEGREFYPPMQLS